MMMRRRGINLHHAIIFTNQGLREREREREIALGNSAHNGGSRARLNQPSNPGRLIGPFRNQCPNLLGNNVPHQQALVTTKLLVTNSLSLSLSLSLSISRSLARSIRLLRAAIDKRNAPRRQLLRPRALRKRERYVRK